MTTEYKSTDLGEISVDNEVIKNISLKAATEVAGIYEIGQGRLGKMWNILTQKSPARGVKLKFSGASELSITLKLMVLHGVNIPDAAGAVQENVKNALEHMTGITVNSVAVQIVGIIAKKESEFASG